MNKETLSVTEAQKILENLGNILDHCASCMSEDLNEFLRVLSTIWEDNIARDLGRSIFDQSQTIMDVLSKNYNTMADTLEDIVRYYKNVGGMDESFYAVHRTYQSHVDKAIVKEYFSDGNGDDFGFKDIINGPDIVKLILKEYINNLQKVADHVKGLIAGSNAFGNYSITQELSASGARIVEIVKEASSRMTKSTEDHIELAAKMYGKIGQEAKEQLEQIRSAINE